MQQQLEQMETELTRLQIELRQVRQMIGSLIRTQEETKRLMAEQPVYSEQAYQQYPGQQQTTGNAPWMQNVNQQANAYEQMRQIAEAMNNQLHQMSGALHPHPSHTPGGYGAGNSMYVPHNDPMQNQY